MMNKFIFPYHLVSESPWPLLGSLSLIIMMIGGVKMFFGLGSSLLILGYLVVIMVFKQWWRDVIRESTFQGAHTLKVMSGIRIGMLLFILSEVMFFISFFWCYFHMFLSPSVEIGGVWPPKGILVFDPYSIPLLNTLILLSSGVTITWAHYSLMSSKIKEVEVSILMTIFLGSVFIFFQFMEYKDSFFSISDSVYGSIFFLITGFHGFHVIMGVIFIFYSVVRIFSFHYTKIHHLGFEVASWYWHFVDVVWLFLYLFVYWLSY
uniref:Cytochrome c oxidase subunit 3 n=1 Tax=Euurobracon breviterebrae TaxID=1421601 RepID=A0A0A6ZKZ8_9HYME|nr:cytochrome c oxidase subunit III [Euurobracon breviterebrae]